MGWQDDLPEAMRDAPFIGKAESMEDAIQQIHNAAGHMGNSIRIPGPDAGEEATSTFRAKVIEKFPDLMLKPQIGDAENYDAIMAQLGMPDDAGKYKAPEDVGLDEGKIGKLAAMAHKGKLTQAQFEALVSDLAAEDSEISEAQQQAQQDGLDRLKGEWGLAFDKKMADAAQALKDTEAPEALAAAMEAGTLPPETLRWLAGIGDQLGSEPTSIGDDGKGVNAGVMTPEEAEQQITEIMNRMYAKTNPPLPDELARLNKKRIELEKFVHPDLADQTIGGVGFG